MSEASDLIERAEKDAGCRFDDPENSNALAILFGAVAREIGVNKFDERDDLAVGTILMNKEDSDLEQLLKLGIDPKLLFDLLK